MASERIVSLQILRFAAATGVMALHVSQTVGAQPSSIGANLINSFGPLGVDVFFVLSGFIIATASAGKRPGEFLKRRFTRILPLYWILTAVMMGLYAVGHVFDPHRLIPSFLFIPTLGYRPFLQAGWTLCFEVLFYAAFAAVLLEPRKGVIAALGTYTIAALGREAVGGPALQFIGNPLIVEFLAGCLIAVLPRSRVFGWASLAGALAGFLVIAVLHYDPGAPEAVLTGNAGWKRILIYGVPSALLIYAAVQATLGGMFCNALAYLGDASYSAYLTHEIALICLIWMKGLLSPAVAAPLMLVACWILAVVVHERLEKPLLSYFRRSRPSTPIPSLQIQPNPPP